VSSSGCKSKPEADDCTQKTDKAISFVVVVNGHAGVACLELGVAQSMLVIFGEFSVCKVGHHRFKFEREVEGDA